MPSGITAVELLSASVSVECAAVLRSPATSSAGACETAVRAPPQLTTIRAGPSDSSNASVEAHPVRTSREIGGGAASIISTVLPAASR